MTIHGNQSLNQFQLVLGVLKYNLPVSIHIQGNVQILRQQLVWVGPPALDDG